MTIHDALKAPLDVRAGAQISARASLHGSKELPGVNLSKNIIFMKAEISGGRIDYTCDVQGPWSKAFNDNESDSWFVKVNGGEYKFFVEYGQDLTGLPQSLAILPFLANVLPMAWFYDATVYVPELDKDFFECLPDVKEGMSKRHPGALLGGTVVADELVVNHISSEGGAIALFSGGVDATFTAVENLHLKPTLTTVWGADIYLRQEQEWQGVSDQNKETADRLGLGYASIKSSFRSFLNYEVLKRDFDIPLKMPSWWYSVQHSIALVALCAPLAWARGSTHVVIASSYSIEDDPATKCCNWPDIDGKVRFGGISSIHHDFSFTRQQKIETICRFHESTGKRLNLRVCWSSVSATNCCACEKCARTIYGIIAEGKDPTRFGFLCDDAAYENLRDRILSGKIRVSSFWEAVVERIKENVPTWQEIDHIHAVVEAYERSVNKVRVTAH